MLDVVKTHREVVINKFHGIQNQFCSLSRKVSGLEKGLRLEIGGYLLKRDRSPSPGRVGTV